MRGCDSQPQKARLVAYCWAAGRQLRWPVPTAHAPRGLPSETGPRLRRLSESSSDKRAGMLFTVVWLGRAAPAKASRRQRRRCTARLRTAGKLIGAQSRACAKSPYEGSSAYGAAELAYILVPLALQQIGCEPLGIAGCAPVRAFGVRPACIRARAATCTHDQATLLLGMLAGVPRPT